MREGKQTINTALLSGTENPGSEEDTEVDGYHPASSVRSRAGYAQGTTYTKEGVSLPGERRAAQEKWVGGGSRRRRAGSGTRT